MRQIYDFEQYVPPELNEAMLQHELERRQLRKQIILLALAVVLSQTATVLSGVLSGVLVRELLPVVSTVCFGYTAISAAGSVVIAVVYSYRKKGGDEVWQLV